MSTLTNALPIVAAAYGRKFGVQVLVGGTDARTNGKTIQIPAMNDDPEAKLLAFGYLTHEAGHIRHTDFAVWPPTSPLGVFIVGVIEDVRIENALLKDYPGSRQTMDTVLTTLIRRQEIVPVTEADEPTDVLCNGFLALARYKYRHQKELAVHAQEAEQVMRAKFTARFVNRLRGLMTEIAGLKSTADSKALALKILALIEQESQRQPPPANNPQQKRVQNQGQRQESDKGSGQKNTNEEEGDSGTGEQPDSSTQAENGHDPGNEGSGKPKKADQDSSPHTDEGQGSPSTSKSGEEDQPGDQGQANDEGKAGNQSNDSAGRSALRSTLSSGMGDMPEDVFAKVAKMLNAEQIPSPTLMPKLENLAGDSFQGRLILQRVRNHSAHLTASLQGLVQAHTMTKYRTVRQGRVIDPKRLHRVAVNDSRIFAHKDQRQSPNTAIHLVVDLSGSMCGGKDAMALDAAMALALALEPIRGVTQAITAFPGSFGLDDRVVKILGHGEQVRNQVGYFAQRGRGGTPMTGALWYAAADLLARTEERKVMLVLTDGSPNHFASASDMVKKAMLAGIQVIGVGIEYDVTGLFPVAIRITNVADLKRELFRIAERLLIR